MSRVSRLLPLLALFPLVSFAQGTAPNLGADAEAARYPEIERGFFFGVAGGASLLLEAPGPENGVRPFSSGMTARVEMGYDFGEHLALSIFVQGAAQSASAEYIGFSNGLASGDFGYLMPGASLRASIVGFGDSQDVKRTWIYARGQAGYTLWRPKALLPDADIQLGVGPGVEYFTRLRHFSVGLEVLGTYLLDSGTTGVLVLPNVRYAF